MIRTAKMKDFNIHKVSSKRIVKAGTNLAFGYAFIPFIKIKSLSKKK